MILLFFIFITLLFLWLQWSYYNHCYYYYHNNNNNNNIIIITVIINIFFYFHLIFMWFPSLYIWRFGFIIKKNSSPFSRTFILSTSIYYLDFSFFILIIFNYFLLFFIIFYYFWFFLIIFNYFLLFLILLNYF